MATYSEIQNYRRSVVKYASVVFDITGIVEDLDVKANSTLFDNVEVARELCLRTTQPIDIRFNSPINDQITLFKGEGIDMGEIPISNVYITTSAVGGFVRLWIVGYN
jgi:hypothetical protein